MSDPVKGLVSIIVPAYQAEPFLEETLQSVLDQTYSNWELIVVNDGSKDRTGELARKFDELDERVMYNYQENAGVSAARNRGVDLSKGEYLAFLDADDVWTKDFLSDKVAVLDQNPTWGMVNANARPIDVDSKEIDKVYLGHQGDVVRSVLTFKDSRVTFPSNVLLRRSVFMEVGGFNPRLSNVADKMLYLDVGDVSPVGYLDKIHLLYREHPNSMHMNMALMERDYMSFLSVVKEKGLLKKYPQTHFPARVYKICAGAFLQTGNYPKFLRYLLLSSLKDPKFWWSTMILKKP